ncbi:MAG: 23S rRNA (guanosine(2251)-2'-O)-methyltransferase RlmB [Pseudomonadota bacterium]
MKSDRLDLTIWGRHAVREALASARAHVQELFTSDVDKVTSDLEEEARKRSVRMRRMARTEMDGRFGTDKHQGVGARVELEIWATLREWIAVQARTDEAWTVLAPDEIQDPQNLGTLIRSAHFFGASALILTKDRCAPITGVVGKASAGAVFSLPIIRATNLARELETAGEEAFWRVGLSAEAPKALSGIDLKKGRTLLVLGSEGEGLRPLTSKRCDELASLPGTGARDSLNVAIAASIALYEISRQRSA